MSNVLPALRLSEGREPFWARCVPCGWAWPAAFFPMAAETFARLAQAHSCCPMCGASGADVVVARPEDVAALTVGDAP